MKTLRIKKHPILGPDDFRNTVAFTYNGKTINALEGDTLAAALLANGIRSLRAHEESGSPRSFYCNIGHCFECRVTVNGKEGVRACLTPVSRGVVVESGKKLPLPFKDGGEK
ncbi:sarcosine oxidase subunit alpha [Scopulibacillus darangshiensis]|uniref:Sarcosine oxidase subunit alpha n=1 Tax=Scopulibacillus darangshiensis TaxID=442528 RepID=A0A4R2NP81_9BACL|nr:(2Fe-2S)-binding protein [Scopulibacillus darangshiensis]TCP23452.1 sarcosine oxidase subunit alpha [Scopulibacillus darangshiensis]